MNKIRTILSVCIVLALCLSSVLPAFAAETEDAVIDTDADCSLTIWKYDWTNAVKDGVWDEDSFSSTGWRESYVEEILGGTVRTGDADGENGSTLGNGQNANGYAVKGVGFSILKAADIVTFSESADDGHPDYSTTMVLYGFDREKAEGLLSAIGLGNGSGRYENADGSGLDDSCWYYTSDTLNKALSDSLEADSTGVKDALEQYMAEAGAIAMPLTDGNGKSIVRGLPVGLYLAVETRVPEEVTSTTDPFFVSLPMTTVSGDENSSSPEGGHFWNYDVVVYPKNRTGIPSLEKTVRESSEDTGNNDGSDVITDGFGHNATASGGDTVEYQLISTLPSITSEATGLTVYNFYDTLSEGLTYDKKSGITFDIFSDSGCTEKIASWSMNSGKFTVIYSSDDRHMTVDITEAGLAEINGRTENANGSVYRGYSNYTVRITYKASVNSDASAVYGENGNENRTVLTWKRSCSDYYDTLISDAHVYSFGLDLTKVFSDTDSETAEDAGMFRHVKFRIWNETDGYWVTAVRNDGEGVYYVTGHAAEETDAAVFYPVTSDGEYGKIIVKGMEDDEYVLTEIETADGYVLLKDRITVTITAEDDPSRPCTEYEEDTLGVLQNDPHYSFDGGCDLRLEGIPQKALVYNYLTAEASVNGNAVTMETDGDSANAEALLTVVNTPGFRLPDTGDSGTILLSAAGVVLMAGSVLMLFLIGRKKKEEEHP